MVVFLIELNKKLKDPEYRRRFEEADRKAEKQIQRCCYGNFQFLWRQWYKLSSFTER